MPDLFFHLTSVSINPKYLERWKISILIQGTLLPDIVGRIPSLLSSFFGIHEHRWIVPLHTPVCLILFCYLICLFFHESLRFAIFKLLVLGAGIHLFWDVLQEQFFFSDYYLFYPISLYAPKIDLFYYNHSVYLFPLLLLYMLYYINKYYIRKKNDI